MGIEPTEKSRVTSAVPHHEATRALFTFRRTENFRRPMPVAAETNIRGHLLICSGRARHSRAYLSRRLSSACRSGLEPE